ncbi:MAG: DUF1800 family protein [Verrucomicrobia bacterium]|nr:DUF1800 family protein [Verrucomicrobiota bacterium]
MSNFRTFRWMLAVSAVPFLPIAILAEDPPPPRIIDIGIENSQKVLRFTPYPAAQEFKLWRADTLDQPFTVDSTGILSGYSWKSPLTATSPSGFYRVQVTPLDSYSLAAATILNRVSYGPTPDDLDRIKAVGIQPYIEEQLAPETISEDLDIDRVTVPTGWQYVKTSAAKVSTKILYVYLTSVGEGYIDDIKLVAGNVAGVGPNLLRNGDFELPLTTNDWVVSRNHAGSKITTEASYSGTSSLHLVANAPGTTRESSIWQTNLPVILSSQSSAPNYTLSYWFLHSTNAPSSVTVRFSNGGVVGNSPQLPPITRLTIGSAPVTDLQAWFILHAVRSQRQLLEVLSQFLDNHFVTYQTKTEEYLAGKAPAGAEDAMATEFEYRELKKWREVLMNPNGTFYDLLKISAESPAMVIYLDTVASKKGAANENYARELMELFTVGVDNGYDQQDIEQMSRAWTGWRVEKLPLGQETNPFATPISANRNTTPGYWTLSFKATDHDTTAKTIFAGKTVDARFGPPHAGKSYQLNLPARLGTSGMQDGYDIIAHLADLPYTQEYISVKLCRLFVHDRFVHGVYDFTDPNLSAEAALVRDCMKAWDTPAAEGRRGNLRNVLRVILNSSMFRQHMASQQKVRNPFEFTVGAVRALRAAKPTGGFTSDCTGADLVTPMNRLGMRLFNREEPDGWSEFGADWINSSWLMERMRFVQERLKASYSDPVGLLKLKLPSSQWRNAGVVTDYFLGILFPGEGKANLDLDRTTAIAYLNTLDNGITPSSFSGLDPNSAAYNTRVKGMVAYLMGLPRFQEQ